MSYPLLAGAALLFGLFSAMPAMAQEVREKPRAVVELFTSQGCSSCPPADKILEELSGRSDIVALAYHVDYWDYIGWVDTFGDAAHSDHQRAYAASWGSGRIYTPQMVVNGAQGVVGSRRPDVQRAVAGQPLPLPVSLRPQGQVLEIGIDGQAGLGDAVVYLVTFIAHAKVDIERGENGGKAVDYVQVVTGRRALGMWEAGSGAHLKLPLGEVATRPGEGAAIIVQQERSGLPGPILGAAMLTL
ncbi:DUF1223 domain-containing protein [Arsenicitalea aurantiaca]|uniref:DUF1223 domain-containing protein n=1 Tax=Arsenicitalea aurantiaca TaxID=1783274 RepID=A0A433X7H9_9HYPH|nr:DUF1223 domain-containing protein [Arsenicitalea aurantiaca]RUT30024.1 DUF1223 domain-containing protein [Arsenicitalea aurantiaca]